MFSHIVHVRYWRKCQVVGSFIQHKTWHFLFVLNYVKKQRSPVFRIRKLIANRLVILYVSLTNLKFVVIINFIFFVLTGNVSSIIQQLHLRIKMFLFSDDVFLYDIARKN